MALPVAGLFIEPVHGVRRWPINRFIV